MEVAGLTLLLLFSCGFLVAFLVVCFAFGELLLFAEVAAPFFGLAAAATAAAAAAAALSGEARFNAA